MERKAIQFGSNLLISPEAQNINQTLKKKSISTIGLTPLHFLFFSRRSYDLISKFPVGLNCDFVTFPCGILGQVWYLIVSISDLCRLSYLKSLLRQDLRNLSSMVTCWL